MSLTKELFTNILQSRLQTTFLDVNDFTTNEENGKKFEVFIVSPLFEGKSLLDRQRLVHDTIKDEMKYIHALAFKKTLTPEQYAKFNASK